MPCADDDKFDLRVGKEVVGGLVVLCLRKVDCAMRTGLCILRVGRRGALQESKDVEVGVWSDEWEVVGFCGTTVAYHSDIDRCHCTDVLRMVWIIGELEVKKFRDVWGVFFDFYSKLLVMPPLMPGPTTIYGPAARRFGISDKSLYPLSPLQTFTPSNWSKDPP
jgi:hypothetical protein